MHTLIVYAHPSRRSYTYEMFRHLLKSLDQRGLPYEVSDLYQMSFKSDMDAQEYEREGFARLNLALPADVQAEHEKIRQADGIVFLYPVWWSDCPAKLKGWFDRVYSVGYAYGHDQSQDASMRMKTLKYGIVLCTAGHPNTFLEEIGIAESMRKVMVDDRLGKRFEKKEMIILGGTLDKEAVRPHHLRRVAAVGESISEYKREAAKIARN